MMPYTLNKWVANNNKGVSLMKETKVSAIEMKIECEWSLTSMSQEHSFIFSQALIRMGFW